MNSFAGAASKSLNTRNAGPDEGGARGSINQTTITKHPAMKLFSILFTVLTLFFFLPAPAAKADHDSCRTRVSACGSCGGEVRWVYRCTGYDCHGHPIYRWVRLAHSCHHHHHSAPSHHHHSAPSHGHYDSHGHGGFSIRFGSHR